MCLGCACPHNLPSYRVMIRSPYEFTFGEIYYRAPFFAHNPLGSKEATIPRGRVTVRPALRHLSAELADITCEVMQVQGQQAWRPAGGAPAQAPGRGGAKHYEGFPNKGFPFGAVVQFPWNTLGKQIVNKLLNSTMGTELWSWLDCGTSFLEMNVRE